MSRFSKFLERAQEIEKRNNDRCIEHAEVEFLKGFARRRMEEVKAMSLPADKEWWRQMMIGLYESDLAEFAKKDDRQRGGADGQRV